MYYVRIQTLTSLDIRVRVHYTPVTLDIVPTTSM